MREGPGSQPEMGKQPGSWPEPAAATHRGWKDDKRRKFCQSQKSGRPEDAGALGRVATELRSRRKELSSGRRARGRRQQLWEKPKKQREKYHTLASPFSSSPHCQRSPHSPALPGKLRNRPQHRRRRTTSGFEGHLAVSRTSHGQRNCSHERQTQALDEQEGAGNRVPEYPSVSLLPCGQNGGEQSDKTQPGGPACPGKTLSTEQSRGSRTREREERNLHTCLRPRGEGRALRGRGLFPPWNREKPWD